VGAGHRGAGGRAPGRVPGPPDRGRRARGRRAARLGPRTGRFPGGRGAGGLRPHPLQARWPRRGGWLQRPDRALGRLRRRLGRAAASIPERAGRLLVDLVLPAAHLGWGLADEIERLAPFGPGHVEPILAVTGLQVVEARRVGGGGEHLSIRLRRGAETFDAIAFGNPLDRPVPEPESRLDLVATLERDEFQGVPRLRLRVLDYAEAGASPLAARRVAPREVAGPIGQAVAAG